MTCLCEHDEEEHGLGGCVGMVRRRDADGEFEAVCECTDFEATEPMNPSWADRADPD